MKHNLGISIATVLTVAALVGAAAIAPQTFQSMLETIKVSVIGNMGFIFTWPAFLASVFFAVAMFTPVGKLRFGEGPPEFSTLSWIGMLFATGMGIGLLTWGVLEPNYHVDAGNSRDQALLYAFNHWGLLAWAGYLAVGVIFAHAMHNMGIGKPAETLLGGGVLSRINLISLVVSTVIGLSLTFSYAADPLRQAVARYTGVDLDAAIVILVLSAFAIASSTTGIKRGIKWLSNYNTLLALILMTGVFVLSQPLEILGTFARLVPEYIVRYPAMATDIAQVRQQNR